MTKKIISTVTIFTMAFTLLFQTVCAAEAPNQKKERLSLNITKSIPSYNYTAKDYTIINVWYDSSEYSAKHTYAAATMVDGNLYISSDLIKNLFPEIEYVRNEKTAVFKLGNRIAEAEELGYLRLNGERNQEIKVGEGQIRIYHDDYLDELVPLRAILEHLGFNVLYSPEHSIVQVFNKHA